MTTINRPPLVPRLHVDVSGPKGASGSNGSNGYDGGWGGGDGSDGHDAGPASPGRAAGDAVLDLSVFDGEGVRVRVEGQDAHGRPIQTEATLAPGGTVDVDAGGGAGGGGAEGGDGGDGGTGTQGHRAVRRMPAGNGGRGGDGGGAGRGSSGAGGGAGGAVRATVSEADTDALAALKDVRVDGGEGGAPGRNGRPGRGGAGGQGGAGDHWTESGPNNTTTSHYTPGGWDGPRGRDGRHASGTPQRGSDGPDGSFQIDVHGADGTTRTYDERYQMETRETSPVDGSGDGIFEPGEEGTLGVAFRNASRMPSPSKPLTVGLTGSEHVLTSPGSRVELPPSVPPGAQTPSQSLDFTLAPDSKTHAGEPLDIDTSFRTSARAERPGVELAESVHETPLRIRYPVQISAVDGDRTATLAEPARVSWKVKNVSTSALGDASECARMVTTGMTRSGGDADPSTLVFTGPDGKPVSLAEGIGMKLAHLPPGAEVELTGTVGFTANADPYTRVELNTLLNLGALDAPASERPIQSREFSVQLARKYAKDPDATVLLVVNDKTSKEEVAEWEALAARFGQKANVWNISLYGALSLTEAVEDVELGKDFSGKTMVLLNNDFNGPPDAAFPVDMVKESELLIASAKRRMSTYVVGGRLDMDAQLRPQDGEGKVFESRSAHQRAVRERSSGTDYLLGHDTVQVQVWGRPSREKLEKQADKVLGSTHAEHPERRFRLDADYQPPAAESFWDHFRPNPAGTVRLHRGADLTENAVAQMVRSDIQQPAFVSSKENRYAFVKSLTFHQKLESVRSFVLEGKKESEDGKILVAALLSDLAEEQQALRNTTWRGPVSRDELHYKLASMRSLAFFHAVRDHESPAYQEWRGWVIRLAASVSLMTDQAKTVVDEVVPFRRRNALDDVTDDIVKDMLSMAFGEGAKAASKSVRELKNQMKAAAPELTKEERLSMTPFLQPEFWTAAFQTDFDKV